MKDPFDEVPDIALTTEQHKARWLTAVDKTLEHLLQVMEEPIITYTEDDVSSDRLKGAVQAKKIAAFDFLEILARKDVEETNLKEGKSEQTTLGFAERNIGK